MTLAQIMLWIHIQFRFIVRVVDVLAVARRQDLMFQRVHKTALAPHAQCIDGAVDVPVCATENKFTQCKITQKTTEVPQVQCIARTTGVPEVMDFQVPTNNHELDASAIH